MNFLEKALPTVEKGVLIIRLRPNTKAAMDSHWPQLATTDLAVIRKWNEETPDANCGAVASVDGIWFWEIDSSNVLARIEKETGHNVLSEIDTFKVRSRKERGHFYFKQNDASRSMGNMAQTYVLGQDWSARVHNAYVVAPNSIHPDTGEPYVAMNSSAEITEAPQWLIDWLISQKTSPQISQPANDGVPRNIDGLVAHGSIHGYMLTQAGKLRNMGLSADAIETSLLELVHANCAPPINDDKVKTMARSICNFPAGENKDLVLTQAVPVAVPASSTIAPSFSIDESQATLRPRFPLWALEETSIYENLVKPAMDVSSKHAEFIALPAIQLMMNYLSRKVTVGTHSNWNIFVGLISPYGHFFKSSSCQLAISYFSTMGYVTSHTRDSKSFEGKVGILQAGSPEGFGIAVQKVSGKNAILFNDELGKFVSKAGIDGSAWASDLLQWYGAADFSNNVTSSRSAFSFPAGEYTFSWLWATTDRGFNRHWAKLAGISSGLEDRMFFVVSPEKAKPTTPFQDPQFSPAATFELIRKAVNQGKYEFENIDAYKERVSGIDPRSMDLIQKLALYFAIDLGLSTIDLDAVERAVALVEYRNQAARFLAPIEADNNQGRLQKEMVRELRQSGGKMSYRKLCLNLDYARYGLDMWNRAYSTMINAGEMAEWYEETTPGKRATRMVGLVKLDDE